MGADENSATFAFGWVLERSPALLARVVEDFVGKRVRVEHAVIHLQKHREQGGFTDVELVAAGRFHIILEAKRGWDLPSAEQLTRYAVRLEEAGADAERRLVSVSAADAGYASRHLLKTVGGIPVLHCSWTGVRRMAEASRSTRSSSE